LRDGDYSSVAVLQNLNARRVTTKLQGVVIAIRKLYTVTKEKSL